MGDVGSPALVSVSCSTSYYYPCDCATTLTRRDPKQTHTHTLARKHTLCQSSALSHTGTGQAIPKSYFFWTLWELLNLALAGSAGIIIKTLVTRLPVLGGLAASEGNSHWVDDMFPSLHTSTCGRENFLSQHPDSTCASWYSWHLWMEVINARERQCVCTQCMANVANVLQSAKAPWGQRWWKCQGGLWHHRHPEGETVTTRRH